MLCIFLWHRFPLLAPGFDAHMLRGVFGNFLDYRRPLEDRWWKIGSAGEGRTQRRVCLYPMGSLFGEAHERSRGRVDRSVA